MAAMGLGNPKNLYKNFKYLKRLNVRYLIIMKNQLRWAYSKKNELNLKRIDYFLKSNRKKADILYDSKRIMIIRLKYRY